MIRPRIQFDNSRISDIFNKFGFIYLDSDKRTAADESEAETISFPETGGEEIDPRVRLIPFDYKIRFVIEAPNSNTDNVNKKIARFNDQIRFYNDEEGLGKMREIALYNDFDRVKIVGYPKLISVPEEIYHSRTGELDFAVFTLEIHVSHPEKCNFATKGKDEMPVEIELKKSYGEDALILKTSRSLEPDEDIYFLRKGRAVSGGHRHNDTTLHRSKGWHLNRNLNFFPFDKELLQNDNTKYRLTPNSHLPKWELNNTNQAVAKIKKAQRSHLIIPLLKGKEGRVRYGLVIGKRSSTPDNRVERISNVCFFYVNCRIEKEEETDDAIKQWIST